MTIGTCEPVPLMCEHRLKNNDGHEQTNVRKRRQAATSYPNGNEKHTLT